MSVDFSSIANNSALLAAILTPLLGYLNKDCQTYFLNLLALLFTIFMVTIATSTIIPDVWSEYLFVGGIVLVIGLYLAIASEQYYFGKLRLT